MNCALREIMMLRNGKIPAEILSEQNPYAISVRELDGSITRYFFSIPIRQHRGCLIRQFWKKLNKKWVYKSIAGEILVHGKILQMTRSGKKCIFVFPDEELSGGGEKIIRNYSDLLPTPNGIAIKTRLGQGREYHLILENDSNEFTICKSDKCVSLLTREKLPFITLSGVCFTDSAKTVMGAVQITVKKREENKYQLTIKPKTPVGNSMYIDITFYQPSLFRDTTVESRHPKQNNLYASAAYLGTTVPYGEQWLYSELDPALISPYRNTPINSAIWHIPCHGSPHTDIHLFPVSEPIKIEEISWNSRPKLSENMICSEIHPNYVSFHLTKELTDPTTHLLQKGFKAILKTPPGKKLVTVSTADSNYAPQILEITY